MVKVNILNYGIFTFTIKLSYEDLLVPFLQIYCYVAHCPFKCGDVYHCTLTVIFHIHYGHI